MSGFFIEDIRCGVGEGGMACGPVSGPVVAEAKIRDDNGDIFFMCLVEVDGLPMFFKTEEGAYDYHMSEDPSPEEIEAMESRFVAGGDYSEIFDDTESEWYELFRYLIYVVRADWDECEAYQEETRGRYLNEIDIPESDVEKGYN
ncbi:MAG: hypothetical protein Q4C42_11845 [Clostridia bacterium]|nr:hypothetical protein [Clostridia bacterium]